MERISFWRSSWLLIISRKEALGLWIWCSLVASLIVGRGFPPISTTLMSITAFFFIAIAVYGYNDVVDMDADKNNTSKQDRPLSSGLVSRGDAMKLVYIASIIGLSISFLNNLPSFLFSLLYFVLFWLYSYPKIHLKKRFLVKEFVISCGILLIGLSVCYAILGVFSPMVFVGFSMFSIFAFFSMPTGFDSTDVEADKLQGVKTIASIMNLKRRLQLAITGMLIIMTITPFTYINFGYNMLLPILIMFGGLVFLRNLVPLMMSLSPTVNTLEMSVIMRSRRTILTFIFVLSIFLVIGSINLSGYIG
jgi:4-hydroxybenzoate polyprenyltransferase